jgi:hypothetical protein
MRLHFTKCVFFPGIKVQSIKTNLMNLYTEKSADKPSLFFEDYLKMPDFAESFMVLAGEAATKAQLPARVDEIGLVCLNVETTAARLEQKYGMSTFFLGDGSPQGFKENGIEIPFTTRVGFGFHKGVIIELAEPGIGSDVFSQTIANGNDIMINHLGFTARGMDLTRKDKDGNEVSYTEIMKNAGIPKYVEAQLNIMGVVAHIHIFSTMGLTHGVEIEFLDFRLFGINGPKINYAGGIVSFVGWLQERTGHRFFDLKEDQVLPPEKNQG